MTGMDFNDFLDKMGAETGNRKKRPEPRQEVREEYTPPPVKKKPRPAPIQEDFDDYVEPIREKKEKHESRSRIDEDFMDKAYDYAQGVVKVVRQNFKSTEERVAMLESLNHAITYYLQSVGVAPQAATFHQSNNKTVTEGNIWGGATMSESEWNNVPRNSQSQTLGGMNDLTGQTVAIQPQVAPTGDYKPDLKLGIKVSSDGKREADLSGVTASDISEMMVLSGLVGKEKEIKDKELFAAKQEVARQIAEKASK